jgi:hypothetical protein
LGKTSNFIYNDWINDPDSDFHNWPYYDFNRKDTLQPFTKIFAVGPTKGQEELVIYDDGTLVAKQIKLTGSIEWTSSSSPSKNVYSQILNMEKPQNGTYYTDENFPDSDHKYAEENNDYKWHKIASEKDIVYAHTDDGGASW